jgi:hypothetical protein
LVDVTGAIREMTALLRTEAARHAVTIRAECKSDMPHILADRVQLPRGTAETLAAETTA